MRPFADAGTGGTRAPAGAAAVEINLQVCENPGTTWFDDVSFSPAAQAASTSPNG